MSKITCHGCGTKTEHTDSGAVGDGMRATGYTWVPCSDGDSCWICPTCRDAVVAGYQAIEAVLKDRTSHASIYSLTLLAKESRKA